MNLSDGESYPRYYDILISPTKIPARNLIPNISGDLFLPQDPVWGEAFFDLMLMPSQILKTGISPQDCVSPVYLMMSCTSHSIVGLDYTEKYF